MNQIKLFGVPILTYGSLPDDGKLPPEPTAIAENVATKQTKFLSPRYEPSNITTNANVIAVQEAIREAENGQTQQLYRFYRDVLLNDDHIQSCFNTRKLALLAQPLSIMPADKSNPDDVTLAKAMTRAKSDCENWNAGMLALLDGTMWPNSIVERLFRPADAPKPGEPKLQYTLRKFVPVNYQLHCYQWAYLMGGVGLGTASAVQLAGMAGQPGAGGTGMPGDVKDTANSQYTIDLERWEPYIKLWPIDAAGRIIYDTSNANYLDPARHIVHRGHLLQTFRDNWGGPMRAILMWWLLRNLGREWFARDMERYASPWPVGYTDANDPVAVQLLRDAFDLARKIGGLVVDESSRIELKEAMVQGMAQGYEAFLNRCNDAISFHITGMKSGDKPAGMNAGQDNFQQTVREDVRVFDQMMLGETCERQIAVPFRDINGLKGNVKYVWGGLSDVDAAAFATLLGAMKTAGYQLSDESIPVANERTGLVWERAAVPPPPGMPPGANDKNKPGDDPDDDDPDAKAFSAKRLTWLSATSMPVTPVDDVVAKHSVALAQTFRGNLAPVRAIILNSSSRADAEDKLKMFFADWPSSKIASILEEAMQVCAAKGAVAGKV
jgi:phage gp29-like protein